MAGIGEASAVLGVVQLGFSIATNLYSFFSDVKDANDNIQSLASELDATTRHLQSLSALIDNNPKTKGWDDNGLALAKKCVTDCQKCTTKLRSLLRQPPAKGVQATAADDEVLYVSKFDKATWPFLKPQFVVLKQELVLIRVDILLAHTTYNCKVGSSVDTTSAYRTLTALAKQQKKSRRRLEQAKQRQNKSNIKGQSGATKQKPNMRRARSLRRTKQGPTSPRVAFIQSDSASEISRNSSAPSSFVQALEDLENEIKDELEEEIRKKKADADEQERDLQLMKEKAVEEYKGKLRKASDERRKTIADAATKLRETPGLNLSDKQVDTILAKLHPPEGNEELALLLRTKADGDPGLSRSSAQTKPSRSVRSGFKRILGRLTTKPAESYDALDPETLPLVLQDSSQPDGRALLKAYIFYFSPYEAHSTFIDVAVDLEVIAESITRLQHKVAGGDLWLPGDVIGELPLWCQQDVFRRLDEDAERSPENYQSHLLLAQKLGGRRSGSRIRPRKITWTIAVVSKLVHVAPSVQESEATHMSVIEDEPKLRLPRWRSPSPPTRGREDFVIRRRDDRSPDSLHKPSPPERPRFYEEGELYRPRPYFSPTRRDFSPRRRDPRPARQRSGEYNMDIARTLAGPRARPDTRMYHYNNPFQPTKMEQASRKQPILDRLTHTSNHLAHDRQSFFKTAPPRRSPSPPPRTRANVEAIVTRPNRGIRSVNGDRRGSLRQQRNRKSNSKSRSELVIGEYIPLDKETPNNSSSSESSEAEGQDDEDIASKIMRTYTGTDEPLDRKKPSMRRQPTVEIDEESNGSYVRRRGRPAIVTHVNGDTVSNRNGSINSSVEGSVNGSVNENIDGNNLRDFSVSRVTDLSPDTAQEEQHFGDIFDSPAEL